MELSADPLDRGWVRLPPPPPGQAGLEGKLEAKRMPWWANADVGGRSPWDHVPRLREKRMRMLFLLTYHDYMERPNSVFYEIVDAARRHPGLEVADVWGPGWADWDDTVPVSANLARRVIPPASCNWVEEDVEVYASGHCFASNDEFSQGGPVGCGFYDIVWTFSEFKDKDDPLMDYPGCGTLMVHQLGDCHSKIRWVWMPDHDMEVDHDPDHSCVQWFYPWQGNITVSKYAFEMLEVFKWDRLRRLYPGMQMQLFGHSPDSANEWDFYPLDWAKKKNDAVVFGHDGLLYPLRTTVTNAAQSRPPRTFIKHHVAPDFIIAHTEEEFMVGVPPTYWTGQPQYRPQVAIREDFAKGMREARICVFDSVVERKMIRKYAQAWLSGCVVAADLPTEQEGDIREFMIELKASWPIERINAVIRQELANPDALRQKALLGFAYARQQLTNLAKVSNIIDLADRYRRGERGYDMQLGFSVRCRSYHFEDGAFKPPWCEGIRGMEE
ncbi:hypothetical protein DACRYDRAFT_73322 [Dacryopinax primogenitus]|uniref:Uncharacterized protein n=1 Tax=Dacryopinax primogenitus (strain DJM 731) TaxID=1858805 RepID=M5G737_DACPD|nr:uncharacterized protein DACRYDRAFT_73322 [Dacryopinax primogenitus]EJU06056.1 hypothetical protein DACRYDRAFT_73322 [Dacryopinax primogenitus]